MVAWDVQGLYDGVYDFMSCWGNVTLTAAHYPRNDFYPAPDRPQGP